MAGQKNIIVGVGANTAEFNRAMKRINSDMGNMQKSMAKFGGMMAGVFSVGVITAFGRASLLAADEQRKANDLLLAALDNRVDVQERLLSQAESIRKNTGIDDSVIIEVQAFSAAQGRSELQIKKNTAAAVQLSAIMKIDLMTAMKQVDATMEGNVGRLGKLDAGFKELSVSQLKNGEAVDLILGKYNGLAESQATSLELLTSNWGEFQEQAGNALGVVLNPLLREANKLLNQMLNSMNGSEFMAKAGVKTGGFFSGNDVVVSEADRMAKSLGDLSTSSNEEIQKSITETAEKIGFYTGEVGNDLNRMYALYINKLQNMIAANDDASAIAAKVNPTGGGKSTKKSQSEIEKSQYEATVRQGEALDALTITWGDMGAVAVPILQNMGFNLSTNGEGLLQFKDGIESLESPIRTIIALVQEWTDANTENLEAIAYGMSGLSSLFKENTIAYKLMASAEATISTWLAVANIMASTAKLGPIAMGIAIAGTIASGLAAVAKINGVGLAEGGIVPGGYPNDSYPAMLTSGETVVPAKRLPDFSGSQQVEVFGVIKAGDIYLSNKRGQYLANRRGL
jgi:hypothetical protein